MSITSKGPVHELLDMNDVFDIDGKETIDAVLMHDSETICQTIHQLCELEQQEQQEQKRQTDHGLLDWIKAEDDSIEIRQAEACAMDTLSLDNFDTNKAVEDALYCDDDDEDDDMKNVKNEVCQIPIHPQPLSDSNDSSLLSDTELPNILDMFTSMYAEQPSTDMDTKYNPLSIHIPAPIAIPQYQAMQPPIVTYQNTRLLAPHSTPNIHFSTPTYFNQPTQSPNKPPLPKIPPSSFAMHSLLSPTYHDHIGARLNCPRARTPKALPRFTLSPDIAEQKLMRIFLQNCDPVTKGLSLQQLITMFTKHRIKEDTPLNMSALFPPNETTTTTNPFPYSLFTSENDALSLEVFQTSFQICNRCTELKRKQHHAIFMSRGPSSNSMQHEDLLDDVAPVIVRVVPTTYEGPKIKSCDHFQWTWCEGFDKTMNEKCNGTNRHDKCPKYLANCTLWKHRLPPKNRKSKNPEDMDSPAKKLKFFS